MAFRPPVFAFPSLRCHAGVLYALAIVHQQKNEHGRSRVVVGAALSRGLNGCFFWDLLGVLEDVVGCTVVHGGDCDSAADTVRADSHQAATDLRRSTGLTRREQPLRDVPLVPRRDRVASGDPLVIVKLDEVINCGGNT